MPGMDGRSLGSSLTAGPGGSTGGFTNGSPPTGTFGGAVSWSRRGSSTGLTSAPIPETRSRSMPATWSKPSRKTMWPPGRRSRGRSGWRRGSERSSFWRPWAGTPPPSFYRSSASGRSAAAHGAPRGRLIGGAPSPPADAGGALRSRPVGLRLQRPQVLEEGIVLALVRLHALPEQSHHAPKVRPEPRAGGRFGPVFAGDHPVDLFPPDPGRGGAIDAAGQLTLDRGGDLCVAEAVGSDLAEDRPSQFVPRLLGEPHAVGHGTLLCADPSPEPLTEEELPTPVQAPTGGRRPLVFQRGALEGHLQDDGGARSGPLGAHRELLGGLPDQPLLLRVAGALTEFGLHPVTGEVLGDRGRGDPQPGGRPSGGEPEPLDQLPSDERLDPVDPEDGGTSRSRHRE